MVQDYLVLSFPKGLISHLHLLISDILNFQSFSGLLPVSFHVYLCFRTLPTHPPTLHSSNLPFRSSHKCHFVPLPQKLSQPCCRVCVSVIKFHGTASLIALRTLYFNCLLSLTRTESLSVSLDIVCLVPMALSKR
uniref:Uncharacterized protein n=1 Tax=Rousettus aegyptiacus TaxID=9407 RepID=A0A7J8GAE7_ROUAE|nr:hypothetical protein HJG63_011646 [Rousettus aegyptiacus]